MRGMAAPGVYFEPLQPSHVIGDLLRSDIAGFIGYTRKGPVGLPVRVESWRQYLSIFGDPMEMGHLAPAIKGFFENGGITCYILRLVDDNARDAMCLLDANGMDIEGVPLKLWRANAAFRVSDIVVSEEGLNQAPDSAILHYFSPGQARNPIPSPGFWGNAITLSVRRSSRLSTRINGLFDDDFGSYVDNLVGLEPNSVVELSQDQPQANGRMQKVFKVIPIQQFDKLGQSIIWKDSVLKSSPEFFADRPIRLDTVEFDVTIEYENKQVEYFQWLSPHPQHSQSLHHVLAQQSQFINLSYIGQPDCDWHDSAYWPHIVEKATLHSGKDGLAMIDASHYLAAISTLSHVSEIAIVAAPDLVLGTDSPQLPQSQLTPKAVDCSNLNPPRPGQINGLITDGEQPLVNVLVVDVQSGKLAKTDINGQFVLSGLDISLRTLRFEKDGFNNEERQVFSSASPDPTQFSMEPLAHPRSLSETEILSVQRAMLNPAQLGRFRVTLIDPPNHALKVEHIRHWRAKLGDSNVGALLYPWLSAPHPTATNGSEVQVPPSGHVAGLIAQMDLAQGPHRSAANIKLRYAKGINQTINDIHLGLFNPEGISTIRSLSGQGLRLFGVRTLSADTQWLYLPVRRLILALSKTLETALQWVVFENNTTVLRQAVTLSVQTLLNRLWRAGALAGSSADEAYRIKCDDDNNPQSVRDQGQFMVEIAVAPSIPFEFIHIRLGRTLDALEVTD